MNGGLTSYRPALPCPPLPHFTSFTFGTLTLSEISFDPILAAGADPVQAGVALKQLADDPNLTGPMLVDALAEDSSRLMDADPAITGGLLRLIHLKTLRAEGDPLSEIEPAALGKIIESLSPEVSNRHLMLQLLAMRSLDSHRQRVGWRRHRS